MERFIPYQRLSKKQKRMINSRKRASWRISPVTRKTKNPKAYDRKKTRSDYYGMVFCCSSLGIRKRSGLPDLSL